MTWSIVVSVSINVIFLNVSTLVLSIYPKMKCQNCLLYSYFRAFDRESMLFEECTHTFYMHKSFLS